jgi:6-pyruvoyltetrahydropterin/6-carboxytetrahydropterin synthase
MAGVSRLPDFGDQVINLRNPVIHIKSVVFLKIRDIFATDMQIYKEFSFDSAHFLPNVPDGHKCKEMHGHTYRLKVFIQGDLDPKLGWIMDFKELKDALLPVIDQLDHKLINNIKGLENPTAENITVWIWEQIRPSLPLLSRIELYETPTTGVIYEGQ